MATSSGKSGLTIGPRSTGLSLPQDNNSLNEKLRSLMRGSEIALMRISCNNNIVNKIHSPLNKQTSSTSPPSTCPLRTTMTTNRHPSPSIGVTSNNEDSNTITISITSSGSGKALPSSSSTSHGPLALDAGPSKKCCVKPRNKNSCTSTLSNNDQPKPSVKKRKKETPKISTAVVPLKCVYTKPCSANGSFDDHFEEELTSDDDGTETESIDDDHPSRYPIVPFPSTCFQDKILDDDIDMTDLRSRILTQKLFLKRLIRVKIGSMDKCVNEIEEEVKRERQMVEKQRSYLDEYLDENRKRVSGLKSEFKTTPMSIRKGICCFTGDDESRCLKPSIPFARHCLEHILYNVDQVMFERCTAKDPVSLTQCSNPTFDIERDEPLCDVHLKTNGDKLSESSQEMTKNTPRRRAKASSSRRKKRKPNGGKGCKDIKSMVDDSGIESNQLILPDADDSVASSESAIDNIPLRSLTNGVDTASLDVGINLAPVDEALVASLVHELPFESEQSEFNMIPDESFTDIFNEPLKPDPEVGHQQFALKSCNSMPNGDSTYYPTGHLNGHGLQSNRIVGNQMMPNPEDISILPTNILDFLTTEQQQQLNGLIDGDLSLTSSPTIKSNPSIHDYTPNGHNIYHPQQLVNCHPINGLRHVPASLSDNHNQMLPPPAAFAQYGPRHNQSLTRSISLPNRFHSGTSSSSIKLSTTNDANITRDHFVKIGDVSGSNLVSSSIMSSNQFPKVIHPVSRTITSRSNQQQQQFHPTVSGVPSIPVRPYQDKPSGS